MKDYRILVGIPTGGSVEALTVQSLVDLFREPIEMDHCRFHLDFAGCFVGCYVQWNVAHLFEALRQRTAEPYVGVLRIDSDMSWTDQWVHQFFGALDHLLSAMPQVQLEGPWALGGVYPRRQPMQNHVPVVTPLDGVLTPGGGKIAEAQYLHWAWRCYDQGETIEVARVGGGFVFFSREVCFFGEEKWIVRPGVGEDYALCQAITGLGRGKVFACWPYSDQKPAPLPGGAQLYHGLGHELHTLDCYFRKAREAGLDATSEIAFADARGGAPKIGNIWGLYQRDES